MKHFTTKKIVVWGLLAALVVAGSAIRVTMPLAIAGTTSFHLGNIMCALAGILLGPVGGGLAAGVGSAIYDMTNPLYISEAWITFLFKGAYGLAAGLVACGGRGKDSYLRCLAATCCGAAAYAVLYLCKSYFYNARFISGLEAGPALAVVAAKLPATGFNAVVAIVCAPLLAKAIIKALRDSHMTLE